MAHSQLCNMRRAVLGGKCDGAVPCDHNSRETVSALAEELETTRVRVEFSSRRGGLLFAECVVVHRGDDVVDVRLPASTDALRGAAGVPDEAAAAFEGHLEILARQAFARGGR